MTENNKSFPELPPPRELLCMRPDCKKILEKLSKDELLFLFNNGKNIQNTSYSDIQRYRWEMGSQKALAKMEESRKRSKNLKGAAYFEEERKWQSAYERWNKIQNRQFGKSENGATEGVK